MFQGVCPEKLKGTFFGLVTLFAGIGSSLTPLISGILIDKFGFFSLVVFQSTICILLLVLTLFFVKSKGKRVENRKFFRKVDLSILKVSKVTQALALYYLISGIPFVVAWIYFPFFSLQIIKSYAYLGSLLALMNFIPVLGRVPFGYLSDNYGWLKMYVIGNLLVTLTFIVLPFTGNPVHLLVLSTVVGLGISMYLPCEEALINVNVDGDRIGEAMNVLTFLQRIGTLLGAILGGIIASTLGLFWVLLFAGIVQAMGFISFLIKYKYG